VKLRDDDRYEWATAKENEQNNVFNRIFLNFVIDPNSARASGM